MSGPRAPDCLMFFSLFSRVADLALQVSIELIGVLLCQVFLQLPLSLSDLLIQLLLYLMVGQIVSVVQSVVTLLV